MLLEPLPRVGPLPSLALGIAGLGIGWLAGLSVSPAIASILGTLMVTASAAVAALTGFKKTGQRVIDPWPFCALVIGLAAGAPVGVEVRVHEERTLSRSTPDSSAAGKFALYASEAAKQCAELQQGRPIDLPVRFRNSTSELIGIIGRHVSDVAVLDSVRTAYCGRTDR